MKNFNITDTLLPYYYPYNAGGLYQEGGPYTVSGNPDIQYQYPEPVYNTFTTSTGKPMRMNTTGYSPAETRGDRPMIENYKVPRVGTRNQIAENQETYNAYKQANQEYIPNTWLFNNPGKTRADYSRMIERTGKLPDVGLEGMYTKQDTKTAENADTVAPESFWQKCLPHFGGSHCIFTDENKSGINSGESAGYANGGSYYDDEGNIHYDFGGEYKKGGIYIKPENRGKFTAYKKRTGKTTEEATHSKDPRVRKMAIFAQNAAKWKHEFGGNVFAEGGELSEEDQLRKDISEQLQSDTQHNVIGRLISGGMDRETAVGLVNELYDNPYEEEDVMTEEEPQEEIQEELIEPEEEEEAQYAPEEEGMEPYMAYGGSYSPYDEYQYGGGFYSDRRGYPYKTVVASAMTPNTKAMRPFKELYAGLGLATGLIGSLGVGYTGAVKGIGNAITGTKSDEPTGFNKVTSGIMEGSANTMDALMGYQRPVKKAPNPYQQYFRNAGKTGPQTTDTLKTNITPMDQWNNKYSKPQNDTWAGKMENKYMEQPHPYMKYYNQPTAPSRFGTPQVSRFAPLPGAPGATATPSNQVYDTYGKQQNDLWRKFRNQSATPQQNQISNYSGYMDEQNTYMNGGQLDRYQTYGQVTPGRRDPKYMPLPEDLDFGAAYNIDDIQKPSPSYFGQGAFDYAKSMLPASPGTPPPRELSPNIDAGGNRLDDFGNPIDTVTGLPPADDIWNKSSLVNASKRPDLNTTPQDPYSGDALKVKGDALLADIRKDTPLTEDQKTLPHRNFGSYAATANIGLGLAASNYADLDAQKEYEEFLKDRRRRNNIDAGYAYNAVNPRGLRTMNVVLGDDLKPGSQVVAQDTGTTGYAAKYGGTMKCGGGMKCGGSMKYQQGGEYQVSEEELLQLMRDGAEVEFL